jgi:hypothetical protein
VAEQRKTTALDIAAKEYSGLKVQWPETVQEEEHMYIMRRRERRMVNVEQRRLLHNDDLHNLASSRAQAGALQ